MKTVGKQLQEARLAKNWTPELASRETKIKVDRLKDLEADDYAAFNNATYARGFVRTYARALGLDEYKILRQLDNKLPDDDTANIVSAEGGVAYLPETAMPPRVAHRDFTGLYVVLGLGGVVMLVIAFVLFRAYQVGELGRWTGSETAASETTSTNAAPAVAADAVPRAKPIDSDTPPPIPAPAPVAADASATGAPRAQPVDLTAPDANAASASAPPKALPVDPSTLNAANSVPPAPPKALPVDPSTLNANSAAPPPADAAGRGSSSAPPPADIPASAPRALPVNPADLNNAPPPADIPASQPVKAPPRALPVNPADLTNGADAAPAGGSDKPLVLTASHDSFVRVTMLDPSNGDKPVYADVLHGGQSVGFTGHKFSVNVDNPSAVDIKLDGVNYGPHDDGSAPETFTVESHVQ